jgi:outer membrane lipoprotein-sorting protein
MMRRFALLFLLVASACVPRPAAPPASPPPPLVAAAQLLARLDENAAAFRSLEGLAKVRVSSGDKTLSASQVLIVEKPDRFRAETLSPFGNPLLLMATDGASITILIPGEQTFYSGEATARNVQRFTRLPLRLPDLVQLLLYQVPVIPHVRQTLHADEAGYLLSLYGAAESRQELRFDRALRLTGTAYFVADELQLRIGYDRFGASSPAFPAACHLEMPAFQTAASLVFSELQTNVSIPVGRFILSPPPGVEVRPIP